LEESLAHDSRVRFLATLGDASTSRVLNLRQIARASKIDSEHAEKPLFLSPILNVAFILKQRTVATDTFQFDHSPVMVTKIVSPIDPDDLFAGGRSLMVDQRGFMEALKELGRYSGASMDRDLQVLRLLHAIPSLDPFLLRQHLINYKIDVGACYFPISLADQKSMHEFVTCELARLTKLLGSDANAGSTGRMVAAMLSSDVAEELAPLRETLNLSGEDFRQGVFSWRGFLYYKWSIQSFWPEVMKVLRRLNDVTPVNTPLPEQKLFLTNARRNIIEMVRDNSDHVNKSLALYDRSFGALVEQQSPKTFRDFLLSAPYMFVELGEKLGAISHMVGFWKHRFPHEKSAIVDAEELVIILQDFASGFGDRVKPPSSVIKTPVIIDKTARAF
jgi:hypothetical protein